MNGYIVINKFNGQPFTKGTGHFKVYATEAAAKRAAYTANGPAWAGEALGHARPWTTRKVAVN